MLTLLMTLGMLLAAFLLFALLTMCAAAVVDGAALLQDPELLQRIVSAVRRAVPAQLPVSAKMRLGYHDASLMRECAQAMQDGGACEIVVHARTKLDGYRPPAYWELIPAIRAAVSVPVVANGEIWTVQDAQRCRAVSGCDALMLGRGMVADPGLAWAIRAADALAGTAQAASAPVQWPELLPHIARFWQLVCEDLEPRQRAGRLYTARAELVLGLVALNHGVLEKDLLDFLVELDGGQLEQLDGLLQLRREREVLGEFELEAGLHDAMMPQSRKCSPR